MISPQTPIDSVPKISKKIHPQLKKLGIQTVRDLLFHFPSRYEDFSNKKDIRLVLAGETVTIQGEIQKINIVRLARKHLAIVNATVRDTTGTMRATWFNQPFLTRTLKEGDLISLSGKVSVGQSGTYLQNPAYEKIRNSEMIHTGRLISVYPETRGITSRWLRFLIKNFIHLGISIPDILPSETRKKYQLLETGEALRSLHFPKNKEEAERARRRFSFEELLLIQLRVLQDRIRLQQYRAPHITLHLPTIKEFITSLPFELTNAQRRSIWEIIQDTAKPRPMNRLIEGDVGSGKTVVAAAVSLLAVRAGYRVAFMAPTEILARQHYDTLYRFLSPFGVAIGLFIGSEKYKGSPDIFVGTHALIQKHVTIENLGLVIVDEQHRFGVEQRAALLKNKNAFVPHFLSMSATPIPRTLALTIYGDLDLSILDEMPKSRKEVITKIVEPGKRNEAYQFMRSEVKKTRQIFVVCPRIEVAEPKNQKDFQQKLLLADVKAVKEEHKKLSEEIFPDLSVGMLHGKMPARGGATVGGKASKEGVMRAFKDGKIDILVSTSVIEVGVDIPNATVMAIEGAERFGLAQLHQFRGRVGRGDGQSYCLLFTTEGGMAARRLRAVVEAKTGFELAQKDLEMRGPGNVFGTAQWGISGPMFLALSDPKFVRDVRREAIEILKKDPTLKAYPALKNQVAEMQKEVHFE